jgi:hypothetical protein
MGCTHLHGEGVVERHSDRENAIALYLKEHLGAADVKILVDHRSREIVYYVDAGAEPPSLRPLQLSFALIGDHGIEQLEEILDSHRVIERMKETGSEPVTIPNDDLD